MNNHINQELEPLSDDENDRWYYLSAKILQILGMWGHRDPIRLITSSLFRVKGRHWMTALLCDGRLINW